MRINKLMRRLLVLFILVAAGIAVLVFNFSGKGSAQTYNVVLISADTLRADQLGCYGGNPNISKNIDELASEGVLFNNSFSNYDWTYPSHISIFTSLYTSAHNVTDEFKLLDPKLVFLPELLKRNGFKTAAFTGDLFISKEFRFDRGFETFNDDSFRLKDHLAGIKGWLDLNKDKPFFLFLHSYDLGINTDAPTSYFNITSRGLPQKPFSLWSKEDFSKLTKEDKLALDERYDSSIKTYDEALGQFFSYLDALNLSDKTIIIFTSDHGEELLEHEEIGHGLGDPYDTVIKVPLIIRFPDKKYNGLVLNQLVQGIDIFPTITGILNISSPWYTQGENLMPLITGASNKTVDYVFTESDNGTSVRSDEYKYISRKNMAGELYNLKTDPDEQANIISDKPGIASIFQNTFNDWSNNNLNLSLKLKPDDLPLKVDVDHMVRLRSLGYIS